MNFLQKVAKILSTVTEILTGFESVLPAKSPLVTVDHTLEQIIALVAQIETIGTQTSIPNKAVAITPLVAQIILTSPFMANKSIDDQKKFEAAVTTITGGVADLLSSLHGDAVSGQGK